LSQKWSSSSSVIVIVAHRHPRCHRRIRWRRVTR
jgi:hypothetical protein